MIPTESFASEGQLWGKSDSSSVCMRMRGEQSSGMHVKWGDGGDLVHTEFGVQQHLVVSLLHDNILYAFLNKDLSMYLSSLVCTKI